MKYLLVDTMNLVWRAANVTRGDNYDRVGLSAHILLNSLPYCASKFDIDHVIFAYDGYSWRKGYDSSYKLNRAVTAAAKSPNEVEFGKMIMEMQRDMADFLSNKTNATVLSNPVLEADDLIAGWIKHHPNDEHIILSSDSDFKQLLAPNVSIYNGIDRTTTTLTSITDEHGKVKLDKNKKQVVPENPEYFLFEKIVRGDTSDNIRPSYPGVRKKGTKNKVGILEAYADRHNQGYAWNAFMNSVWTDENGEDHIVKDKFAHNKLLIDLSAQPQHILDEIAFTVNNVNSKKIGQVGIHLIKFCGKYNLVTLAQNPTKIANVLAKGKP